MNYKKEQTIYLINLWRMLDIDQTFAYVKNFVDAAKCYIQLVDTQKDCTVEFFCIEHVCGENSIKKTCIESREL